MTEPHRKTAVICMICIVLAIQAVACLFFEGVCR